MRKFGEVFSSLDNTNESSKLNKKFFSRRYYYFDRFDQGVMIDKEGWYSVTPECISQYLATRVRDSCSAMDG